MFDFGTGELFVIAVVALLVVGPKHMPEVLRTINGFVRKVRSLARDFQKGLDDLSKEAGMDELKNEMTELNKARNPKTWVEDWGDDWDDEDDEALLSAEDQKAAKAGTLNKPAAGQASGDGPDLAKGRTNGADASPTSKPGAAAVPLDKPAAPDGADAAKAVNS